MELELICNGGALTLTADAKGWCHVTLRLGGATHQLGADTVALVVKRLVAGLADDVASTPTGKIAGQPVRFVLMLFEHHGSIYAADAAEQVVLYFQNAKASPIGRLTLDVIARARWLAALRAVATR